MKKNFRFIIFILLSFLLFFIFPVKIYETDQFKLTKILNLGNFVSNLNQTPDGFLYDNNECYYFSFKTESIFKHIAKDKNFLTANLNIFIECDKENKKLYLYNNKGELLKIIENSALPYLPQEKELFILLKHGGRSFSLYSLNGELILDELNFDSLITSIDFNNNKILISTISGETILLDNNNKEILFKIQNNKDAPQISTISDNGEFIAICYGITSNKYIEIYSVKKQKIINKIENKNEEVKKISFLRFIKNNLYFENNNTIYFYSLENKKINILKIKGKLKEIAFKGERLLVLTEDDTFNHLYLFNTEGTILLYKELKNEISNIKFIDKTAFYFKYQNKILYISI